MNTTKAIYWIALAAFALALNSEYRHGKFPVLHSVAGRAEFTLCRLASRAEQTLSLARVLTAPQPPEFHVDDEFIARQQAQVERVMAGHQADIDRALAEHQVDLDRAMDLREVDLDRVQQKLDRMHMVFDRAQHHRIRLLEGTRVRVSNDPSGRVVIVCPNTGARGRVHIGGDFPDMDTELSVIEVGDWF